MDDLPTRLRAYRADHDLTQTQLAATLGCNLQTVYRAEKGRLPKRPGSWLRAFEALSNPTTARELAPLSEPDVTLAKMGDEIDRLHLLITKATCRIRDLEEQRYERHTMLLRRERS